MLPECRATCAFVLFLLAVLPGCLVQTETFLTERADAETDDRLIGVWTVPNNEDENGFHLRARSGRRAAWTF